MFDLLNPCAAGIYPIAVDGSVVSHGAAVVEIVTPIADPVPAGSHAAPIF